MIILEMVLGYFGIAIAVMLWLITALASWRVFVKAGVPGWKSLIPIYREYQLFRIAWDSKQFLIYAGIVIISGVMEVLAGDTNQFSVWGMAGAVIDLGVIYYEVMLKMYLARSFGRSRAFGLFLYFLEFLGMTSLGFGPYEYEGPAGAKDKV